MYSRSTGEVNSNIVSSSLLQKWTRLPTHACEVGALTFEVTDNFGSNGILPCGAYGPWWTDGCTEWQSRRWERSRGWPSRRWQDDIMKKEGTTWSRTALDTQQWTALMEGYSLQWMDKMKSIDGGLQPAMDGQIEEHWWRATACNGWTRPMWNWKWSEEVNCPAKAHSFLFKVKSVQDGEGVVCWLLIIPSTC